VSKEARENGVRGPIVGNWRYIGASAGSNRNNQPEDSGNDPF
jgi:hypothetical protein